MAEVNFDDCLNLLKDLKPGNFAESLLDSVLWYQEQHSTFTPAFTTQPINDVPPALQNDNYIYVLHKPQVLLNTTQLGRQSEIITSIEVWVLVFILYSVSLDVFIRIDSCENIYFLTSLLQIASPFFWLWVHLNFL